MESKLSASSDKADCATLAGGGTSADPEASSDQETPKEQDAPSSCEADLEGVPVIMHSTLDWEAVTTPDATFLGVALGARVAPDGVVVLRGTYSVSCSLSELMTRRFFLADGAIDFEPHVYTLDLVLVTLEIVPLRNQY